MVICQGPPLLLSEARKTFRWFRVASPVSMLYDTCLWGFILAIMLAHGMWDASFTVIFHLACTSLQFLFWVLRSIVILSTRLRLYFSFITIYSSLFSLFSSLSFSPYVVHSPLLVAVLATLRCLRLCQCPVYGPCSFFMMFIIPIIMLCSLFFFPFWWTVHAHPHSWQSTTPLYL